jgi:hypothetical protein
MRRSSYFQKHTDSYVTEDGLLEELLEQSLGIQWKVPRLVILLTSRTGTAQSVQRLLTGWTTEGSEFESQYGQECSLFTSSRSDLRSFQLLIQWVLDAISSGVKRPGREADHSPPASAEVKKIWICTSNPPYAFMV